MQKTNCIQIKRQINKYIKRHKLIIEILKKADNYLTNKNVRIGKKNGRTGKNK